MDINKQEGEAVEEMMSSERAVSIPVDTAVKETEQKPSVTQSFLSHKKVLIVTGVAILCVLIIGIYVVASLGKVKTTDSQTNTTTSNIKIMDSFTFLDKVYTKGFTLSPQKGPDYSSESYEWAQQGETVENWTTLVTTHTLTPLTEDKPLSPEIYAQNAVAMNEQKGGVALETSRINTPDAIKEGVDPNNPPYLFVYIFAQPKEKGPSEINIQKVVKGENGEVKVFVFAKRILVTTQQDVKAYLESTEYSNERMAVIMTKFP